jgi:hypothetical protein
LKDWGFTMFDDLPSPFMAGSVKVWPCASRPGFQWFIAFGGQPHYFRSRTEAMLFAKDVQSVTNDA